MKWKRLVSILLAGCMAGALLAGCGSSSSEEEVITSAEAEDDEDDEIVEIELYTVTMYGADGAEEVENAINAISEEEIGVHVNLNLIDMGAYAEQISLMFSSNEQMDLLFTIPLASAGFSSLISQNQLMSLNDLLPEYAPELYEMMKDYLAGTTVNGNVYGVSGYRLLNSNAYVIMRADILEDLSLTEDAENASSWSDIEAILQTVVDSGYDDGKVSNAIGGSADNGVTTPEYMLAGEDDWSEAYGYDSLGDTYRIVAVDESTDTVVSYYESEDFYNMVSRVNDWYDSGLVYRDSATAEEGGDTLIANDVSFAVVLDAELGVEASKQASTGYEVVCPMITSLPISTSSVTKMDWTVPVSAAEPEAAVEFLNLMYTNSEIENLLVWGIEGRDYEVNEEGEAVLLDTVEYQSADYLWGNQFLAYPAEGQGGDFREVSEASMESAEISPYFGVSVDTTEIANELTAVYNVIQEYAAGYESGSTAVPDTYEEYLEGDFVKALESAGIQEVLSYYQTALDEWLEQQ